MQSSKEEASEPEGMQSFQETRESESETSDWDLGEGKGARSFTGRACGRREVEHQHVTKMPLRPKSGRALLCTEVPSAVPEPLSARLSNRIA